MHIPKPHIHDLFVRYFSNKELDELYLSVFLKTFAEATISIFIPIYLLTLGFTLVDIALYYLLYYSTVMIIMFPGMWLNASVGIKKTMALGTIALIGFYYAINQLEHGLSYLPLAVLLGISTGLYYAAFYVEFTKSAVRKEEGRDISVLSVFAIIAGILGPLLGSLFIENVSFNFVFLVVAGILALSIFPLFFTTDTALKRTKFSWKKLWQVDRKEHAAVYQAEGALNTVGGIFWPVFIYLAVKSIVTLGAIISITSLFLVVFIIYVGELSDRNPRQVLKWGVFLNAPFWIIRLFFLSPLGLFITNLLSAATSSLSGISFNKIVYARAKKTRWVAHFFLFRELHLTIGRVILLGTTLIMQSILWMFILAFFLEFVRFAALRR